MDESGGSGQPRSGSDEATERPAGPSTPATDSAPPEPEPSTNGPAPDAPADGATPTRPEPPADHKTATPTKPSRERSGSSDDHGTAAPAEPSTGREAQEHSDSSDDRATPAHPESSVGRPTPTPAEPPAGHGTPTRPETQAGHGTGAPAEPSGGHGTPVRPEHQADTSRAPTSRPRGDAVGRTPSSSGGRKPPKRPKEPGGGILMGRPFGVPVYVAPSWFLVAALITWVFGGQLDRVLPELGGARYLVSLFFAVAFYASVLIHELAHTVAALRFKLPVRRIQLQFFGGVSEIEKESETPGREFVLAFVGPLLSLVLAGLFYLALLGVEPGTVPGVLLAGLMISNLIVAAFNLLPGLPLDGGRMLRAVVWKITGKPMTGTVAAAWVGRALAVSVLIGLPLLTQSGALGADAEDLGGMDTVTDALLAAILAAIIWTGAGNSLRMARLREHLPELRARKLTRRAVPVQTDTPLSEALRRANDAGARALVVVDAQGEPLSLVREAAIVGVPEHRRPWVAVSGLAQDLTDGMRVSAELAGEDLLDVLRATPATEYLVVEESGEIYGVLSAADVERAFVKAMARPS